MSKRPTLGSVSVFVPAAASPSAPSLTPAISRPDRAGRAPLPFWTTTAAKKQLRMMAAENDTTQQELMTEALNLLFQKRGKPPIA